MTKRSQRESGYGLQNNIISCNLIFRRFDVHEIILLQIIIGRQHNVGICKIQPGKGPFIVSFTRMTIIVTFLRFPKNVRSPASAMASTHVYSFLTPGMVIIPGRFSSPSIVNLQISENRMVVIRVFEDKGVSWASMPHVSFKAAFGLDPST